MSETDAKPEAEEEVLKTTSKAKKTSKKTAKKAVKKKSAKKAAKKTAKKAVKKAKKEAEPELSDSEKIAAILKDSNVSVDDDVLQAALAAVAASKVAKESTSKKKTATKKKTAKKQSATSTEQAELKLQERPSPKTTEEPKAKPKKDFKNKKFKKERDKEKRRPELTGPPVEVDGMLEIAPKGFGFLRVQSQNYEQIKTDVFVTPEFVRKYGLRIGVWVHGVAMQGPRGMQLTEIHKVNGSDPQETKKLPHFDELKAINPDKRIPFETDSKKYTTRVVDIVAPVGRGQRGLIVSPPRSGKTTLLHDIAAAVKEKHSDSLHLMILLVDERPEEVTDFKRSFPDTEIYASSNDAGARNHTRLAELCIERAKRLVEAGKDVFLLMDSITRLARAYNANMRGGKSRGVQSGGIVSGALEVPRRLFAAARNTRSAGSLTILATALVQTNSRADEAIFLEFKGTGNMEFVLDRRIAEQYIYPATDIFKSGTRREELLLPEHSLHKIHLIRRGLAGHHPDEAMQRLLYFVEKFPSNAQMLMEIKG